MLQRISLKIFSALVMFTIVTSAVSVLRAEDSDAASAFDASESVIHVKEPIKLFNGKNLDGFYTFLKDTKYDDPRGVFSVKDGMLVISGKGMGGIITKNRYADYRLICEFRWGERTYGERAERAKDSGILVHGFGPDDAFDGSWMSSIESNIIQGGCGDFILVRGNDKDGNRVSISGNATAVEDRDGEPVWTPDGKERKFTRGRINNRYRDPDWKDRLGFRGKEDVERPDGEWNTMEVICDGDRITVYVNGALVNKMTDASRTSGKITVQTEMAEIHLRRLELLPLETTK